MNQPEIDPAAALARLLLEHPRGFAVNADGQLTPEAEAEKITSFDQLSEMTRAPKRFQMDLPGGKVIELKIRPLNSEEGIEIDNLDDEAPQPPKKKRAGQRGRPEEEYLDFDDKDFKWRDRAHDLLKRTAIICKGVVDLEIPGSTLEEKHAYLSKQFPPRILEALRAAVLGLTSNPIEKAVFI